MPTPEKCPKCKATDDIDNISDLYNLFGEANDIGKEWHCNGCDYMFNDDEVVPWYSGRDFSKMKLSQIADVIFSDWSDITPYARPYIEAMMNLKTINDTYGSDDAAGIVSYFLTNAKKWQGETARKVKAHLRKIVDDYYKTNN